MPAFPLHLFLLLCLCLPVPAPAADPDGTPPSNCTGIRSYVVQFSYSWSPDSDAAFPTTDNSLIPGFSPLVCAVHNSNFTLWAKEERISPAVRTLLVNVTNELIEKRLNRAIEDHQVLQYQIVGTENATATAVTSVALSVTAAGNFTLISCIAKIIPSPDWFVGLTNVQTCQQNGSFIDVPQGGTLFGWDGGIDTAETYTDTSPLLESEAIVVKPAILEAPEGYGTASISPTEIPTPSPSPPSPDSPPVPLPSKDLPPSPFIPTQTPIPKPNAVCIDANALAHFPRNSLLYANHQMARVLCDTYASCATHGHMVYYLGKPMMMSSYCRLTQCTQQLMYVNSPRYSRALRIPSNSPQLQFTALAARYATDIEENLMSLAIRLGL